MTAVIKGEEDIFGLAGGSVAEEWIIDREIGALVAMRLCSTTAPSSDKVQTASELTKKLLLGWHDLVVKDGVVYRRKMKFQSDNVSGRTSDKICD